MLSDQAEVFVASPKGGVAPLDPSSVEAFKDDPSSANFLANKKAVWEKTTPLKEFLGRANEFDAIFFPGGHGPMFDLATDKESIQLIREFHSAAKVIAAVCHGPAALTNVTLPEDGAPLVLNKTVTGFSNAEEKEVQLDKAMPFLLEDALVKAGGKYVKADEPWGVKVVTDGKLITGQNPASARAVGEAILKTLGVV